MEDSTVLQLLQKFLHCYLKQILIQIIVQLERALLK